MFVLFLPIKHHPYFDEVKLWLCPIIVIGYLVLIPLLCKISFMYLSNILDSKIYLSKSVKGFLIYCQFNVRHTPWTKTYLRVRVLNTKNFKCKELLWNQLCSLYYNLLVDIKTVLVWSIMDMLVLYECLMPKNGHFWPKMRNRSKKKNSVPTSLIEQSPNANQLHLVTF